MSITNLNFFYDSKSHSVKGINTFITDNILGIEHSNGWCSFRIYINDYAKYPENEPLTAYLRYYYPEHFI